ncbi:hypothetical protein BDV96DRAFT_256486 [Lophiotrema nucula]|uniref:Secreted protein n=1 Tax=Lophiotrema nucula TaxID=690887 RepID=A0A6A5YNM4_9PLEO|nr:hypothetical protein BDV96DRAFT_256486 [Lophiotrema nucula]
MRLIGVVAYLLWLRCSCSPSSAKSYWSFAPRIIRSGVIGRRRSSLAYLAVSDSDSSGCTITTFNIARPRCASAPCLAQESLARAALHVNPVAQDLIPRIDPSALYEL